MSKISVAFSKTILHVILHIALKVSKIYYSYMVSQIFTFRIVYFSRKRNLENQFSIKAQGTATLTA